VKIKILCLALLCCASLHAESLTRMVLFKLDLPKGSEAEKAFIEKTMALAKVPGVEEFAWMNLSEKNTNFNYGVRIVFPDEAALKAYVKNPLHANYIRDTWKPVVKDMQIMDYTEPRVAAGPAKPARKE